MPDAYQEICAKACPDGCGTPDAGMTRGGIHLHANGRFLNFPCKAPTKDELIDRLTAELAEIQERSAKNHTEAMIAHRFIESIVGESARGRDFSVKVPMAEAKLAALKAERQADTERLAAALQQMNVFFGSMAGGCEDEAEAAINQCRKALAIHAAIDAARQAKP